MERIHLAPLRNGIIWQSECSGRYEVRATSTWRQTPLCTCSAARVRDLPGHGHLWLVRTFVVLSLGFLILLPPSLVLQSSWLSGTVGFTLRWTFHCFCCVELLPGLTELGQLARADPDVAHAPLPVPFRRHWAAPLANTSSSLVLKEMLVDKQVQHWWPSKRCSSDLARINIDAFGDGRWAFLGCSLLLSFRTQVQHRCPSRRCWCDSPRNHHRQVLRLGVHGDCFL